MEPLKSRQTRSLVFAGCFLLAVSFSAAFLYIISGTDLRSGSWARIVVVLYTALALIFLSGGLSIWYALRPKKELGLCPETLTSGETAPSAAGGAGNGVGIGRNSNPLAMLSDAVRSYTPAEGILSPAHLPEETIEGKKIALDIAHQNKKITESINYAKRIQSAILPNMRLIHRALPDSFVLYRPRDVVSGDFPWFAQVRNEVFMAAVDCTGHGVPGALLSLIGYFLLNDIIRSRRVSDPGRILDLLDEGVSSTLKPAEDAGTRDGMDISLCKINLEKREVEYAGAHRPLYMMRSGVFEEIKGNKFPIGGGIFKNQTNFNNYHIRLEAGDSIYYCSDGYCDQFGGPEGRKFGTRQLREIIGKVHTRPMKEAHAVFEAQWDKWKSGHKQTDDVLLIGVKF